MGEWVAGVEPPALRPPRGESISAVDDKGTQGNSKICTTTTTTTTTLTATSRTDTGTTRTIRGDACSSRAHGDTRAQANVESTRPQNSRQPRQRTTRHHMSCGRIRPGPDPKYGAKGFPRGINHGELKLQVNNSPGASLSPAFRRPDKQNGICSEACKG